MTVATDALTAVSAGKEPAARRLLPLVYDELRTLARKYVKRQTPGETLAPTDVVHDAFLRLVDQSGIESLDQAHFFAVAATAMRRVLIDYCRDRNALKRGGGWQRMTISAVMEPGSQRIVDLLALDEALSRLAERSERQARVVEMRFFGGLSVEHLAHVLGISTATAERDWRAARAWLSMELRESETTG